MGRHGANEYSPVLPINCPVDSLWRYNLWAQVACRHGLVRGAVSALTIRDGRSCFAIRSVERVTVLANAPGRLYEYLYSSLHSSTRQFDRRAERRPNVSHMVVSVMM